MEAGAREAVRLHVRSKWFGQRKEFVGSGGEENQEGREWQEVEDQGRERASVLLSRNQDHLEMEGQQASADFHIELAGGHNGAGAGRSQDPESTDAQMRVSESLLSLANYTPAASPSPRVCSPVSLDHTTHDNHAGITEINVYTPHVAHSSEHAGSGVQ